MAHFGLDSGNTVWSPNHFDDHADNWVHALVLFLMVLLCLPPVIMLAQFFPLKPIQERTFRWAFSDNPQLGDEFGEWFQLTMTGYNPHRADMIEQILCWSE